jgi:hypothetical protein
MGARMLFDAGRMRAASLGSRDFSSGAGWAVTTTLLSRLDRNGISEKMVEE